MLSQHQSEKQRTSQINKLIVQLDRFTTNLQSKVDSILKAQQLQFLNAYKSHMYKIKQDFDAMVTELKRKDMQIVEYENDGRMSNLIKRVHYLEAEEKKLLGDLEKRKTEIKGYLIEKEMFKSQIKRLEEKVKELLRNKASLSQKPDKANVNCESYPTFSTQLSPHMLRRGQPNTMTQQKSLKLSSAYRSQKSQIMTNPESTVETNKLQRQIGQLKKQNRQLLTLNSKVISEVNTMEELFVQTVNQIKRSIMGRKKLKECTFEDFRKEDKLELLIKILSNEEALFQLYCLLFGKKSANVIQAEKIVLERPLSLRHKLGLNVSADYKLPNINSARFN